MSSIKPGFDPSLLYAAVELKREEEKMLWEAVARAVWDKSAGLNRLRPQDHPFSASSIHRLRESGVISCQHALLLMWWLDKSPEDFVRQPEAATVGAPLPDCDRDHRPRWAIGALYIALDEERRCSGANWRQIADQLHCTPHQLIGLRTARFGTTMALAMNITQKLHRPAADFTYPAQW